MFFNTKGGHPCHFLSQFQFVADVFQVSSNSISLEMISEELIKRNYGYLLRGASMLLPLAFVICQIAQHQREVGSVKTNLN